jgi:hypothetical protein
MLRGLSPEERRWLARKARLLGGLEPALRFLLRQGLLCDLTIQRWEADHEGGAPPQRQGREVHRRDPKRARRSSVRRTRRP